MTFQALTEAETAAGQPLSQPLMRTIKFNFDDLNARSASVTDFLNGNFEIDSDSDGQPDLWTIATNPGGTVALDTVAPIEGATSLKMIHPGGGGNGGGTALSDFVPTWAGSVNVFTFLLLSSAAGVHIIATAKYYDEDQVTIGADAVIYDSVTNPTATERITTSDVSPATARYLSIEFEGGVVDVDVAATMHFDSVHVLPEGNGMTLLHDTGEIVGTPSTIDFDDFFIFSSYLFMFENVRGGTNSNKMHVRTSTDGGSNYDAGATDYDYIVRDIHHTSGESTVNDSTGATYILLHGAGASSGAGTGLSGRLFLYKPAATTDTYMTFDGAFENSSDGLAQTHMAGKRDSSADVDAIQIDLTSGTFASGRIKMYGLTEFKP